jgi:hypothetical protein
MLSGGHRLLEPSEVAIIQPCMAWGTAEELFIHFGHQFFVSLLCHHYLPQTVWFPVLLALADLLPAGIVWHFHLPTPQCQH